VLLNLVATVYNVGINIFILMNMAMWSPKRIDLDKSGSFNYEGLGAAQWLMGLPIFFSPFVFYLPFALLGQPVVGLCFVALAGIIGFAFRNKLIDLTTKRFLARRYTIASNFRKD
jgi:hypothetical protein